jgi:hypothetical protein
MMTIAARAIAIVTIVAGIAMITTTGGGGGAIGMKSEKRIGIMTVTVITTGDSVPLFSNERPQSHSRPFISKSRGDPRLPLDNLRPAPATAPSAPPRRAPYWTRLQSIIRGKTVLNKGTFEAGVG